MSEFSNIQQGEEGGGVPQRGCAFSPTLFQFFFYQRYVQNWGGRRGRSGSRGWNIRKVSLLYCLFTVYRTFINILSYIVYYSRNVCKAGEAAEEETDWRM